MVWWFEAVALAYVPVPDDELTLNAEAAALAAADMNADGYDDLLVSENQRISVYLGSAAGVASAPATRFSASDRVVDLEVLDANGDGVPDLVTVEETYPGGYYNANYAIRMYQGIPGGFAFPPIQSSNASLERAAISAGDFDGDGLDDLAACTHTPSWGSDVSRCSLLLGSAGGPLVLLASADMGLLDPTPRLGDTDGDGLDDLWLCTGGNALIVVSGTTGVPTGPSFTVPVPPGYSESGHLSVGEDLDGDGFGDVAFSLFGGGFAVVAGGAAGPGVPQVIAPVQGGLPPRDRIEGLELSADVDGDGLGDVVASAPTTDAYAGVVAVWRSGVITPADPGPEVTHGSASQEAGFALTVGDFDGDGLADRAFLGKTGALGLRVVAGVVYGR